jgi:hypothetical protein
MGDYSDSFMDIIWKHDTKFLLDCSRLEKATWWKVFVNGKWIGNILITNYRSEIFRHESKAPESL